MSSAAASLLDGRPATPGDGSVVVALIDEDELFAGRRTLPPRGRLWRHGAEVEGEGGRIAPGQTRVVEVAS